MQIDECELVLAIEGLMFQCYWEGSSVVGKLRQIYTQGPMSPLTWSQTKVLSLALFTLYNLWVTHLFFHNDSCDYHSWLSNLLSLIPVFPLNSQTIFLIVIKTSHIPCIKDQTHFPASPTWFPICSLSWLTEQSATQLTINQMSFWLILISIHHFPLRKVSMSALSSLLWFRIACPLTPCCSSP